MVIGTWNSSDGNYSRDTILIGLYRLSTFLHNKRKSHCNLLFYNVYAISNVVVKKLKTLKRALNKKTFLHLFGYSTFLAKKLAHPGSQDIDTDSRFCYVACRKLQSPNFVRLLINQFTSQNRRKNEHGRQMSIFTAVLKWSATSDDRGNGIASTRIIRNDSRVELVS